MDKSLISIVSDLHVGGGAADPGDDHVCDKQQFACYVDSLGARDEGRDGDAELYINGDFLEFAQVLQTAYTRLGHDLWCSAEESLAKLEMILKGHPVIFDALARFTSGGNQLTIAAGNHDVDLYWPQVQARLRDRIGQAIRFDLGEEWYLRHGGRLQISHGHQEDIANRFNCWADPIKVQANGADRIEMCHGTRFMVEVVNRLEEKYPFADNLQPVTKLANVLLREDKFGFGLAAWIFLKFTALNPVTAGIEQDSFETLLAQQFRTDRKFSHRVLVALSEFDRTLTAGHIQSMSESPTQMVELMTFALARMRLDEWIKLFAPVKVSNSLGADGDSSLGVIFLQGGIDNRAIYRDIAIKRLATQEQSEIVVLGHTHLPDTLNWKGKQYFNPGSWTRYLEVPRESTITMAELRDESKFPYLLQAVEVSRDASDVIHASLVKW